MMVAFMTTVVFALADTVAVSPAGGVSKSSNYILDYGTVVNQKSDGGQQQTKTIFLVAPAAKGNTDCPSGDCSSNVAQVKEIEVITHPDIASSSNVGKVNQNISLRNLIYFSIGLVLVFIIIFLIVRFFRIAQDKNKYD